MKIRQMIVIFIKVYQHTLSPDHGIVAHIRSAKAPACLFYPTCSEYTAQAVNKYGVYKGLLKGIKRIGRCRPGKEPEIDLL